MRMTTDKRDEKEVFVTSLNFAPQWFKSSFSTPGGECVEVAGLPGKRMAVRDSKNPSGPVLEFSMDEWQGLDASAHDVDMRQWMSGLRLMFAEPSLRGE
ncbi:DUF397 domain-containing protein, partial [Nonomuraea sp. NPDC055795]